MSDDPMSSKNIFNLVASEDSNYVLQRREDGKLKLLIHDLIDNNELEMLEEVAKTNEVLGEPCRKVKLLYSKLMMFADELMNCVNNIENTAKTMIRLHGFEKIGELTFDLFFTAHQDLANNCFTSHVLSACSGHNDIMIKNIENERGKILKAETVFAFKTIHFEQEMKKKISELDKKKQEVTETENKSKIIIEEMKRESFRQKKAIKNKDKLIVDLQKKISTAESRSQNKKLVEKSVTILIPSSQIFPKIQLFEKKVSTKSFEEIPSIPKLPAMRPGINIKRRWRSKPPIRKEEDRIFDIDLDDFLDSHYQNNSVVEI